MEGEALQKRGRKILHKLYKWNHRYIARLAKRM